MIVWDKKNERHFIREDDNEVLISKEDFKTTTTLSEDESAIKIASDTILKDHEMQIHIYDKPTLLQVDAKPNYAIWVGPVGTKPIPILDRKSWYEI